MLVSQQKKRRQSLSRRIVSESDLKRFSYANSRRITLNFDGNVGTVSSSSGSSTAVSGETSNTALNVNNDVYNDDDKNNKNKKEKKKKKKNNNNNSNDNDNDNDNNKGNDGTMSSSSSSSNSTTSLVVAPRLKTYNNDNTIVISSQNQEDKQLQLSPLNVINEVKVMDVNGRVVHYSLIRRKDVWFLDVSDLDAMDIDAVFQYIAYRSPPQHDLVLTRVPELRHLVYVKYDEEGRPYPVKMRRVLKANYLKKKQSLSKVLQEEIIQEEIIQEGVLKEGKTITTTKEHYQQVNSQSASDNSSETSSSSPTAKSRSLWDTFSISLIKASTQSTS